MQAIPLRTYVDRVKGAITLDRSTYEEIGYDENATAPAAIFVALVALQFGLLFPDGGLEAAIVLIFLALLTLLLFSALAYVIGTRYLANSPSVASWQSVLRGVGFASLPLLATSVLYLLGLAFIAFLGLVTWTAIAIVAAIRYALDLSLGGAIITAATAALGVWVLRTVVGWLLVLFVGLR